MVPRALGRLMRNGEAPLLMDSFFVAAVASFLGIRAFLAATGYPRIGSNGIHIAHMLWGGLLMLLAILLLIAFLDRSAQYAAAVIGGLGFGTFIDEIGKFVTADNDYFFRPAVAIIYVLFVVTFLVARALVGRRRLTENEALANALHGLAATSGAPIEPSDRARIERFLTLARPESAHAALLRQYLDTVRSIPERTDPITRARRALAGRYLRLMANDWADRALTAAVTGYAVLAVASVTLLALTGSATGDLGVVLIAQLGSTIAGATLIARGLISLPDSRLAAYHWFTRGILVWILITQVFVFYRSELAGLGGLVVDLVAYVSVRFAIEEELAGRHPSPIKAGPA